jgi:hypothetical protein
MFLRIVSKCLPHRVVLHLHVNVKHKYIAVCITTLPANSYLMESTCCRSLYQICTCQ